MQTKTIANVENLQDVTWNGKVLRKRQITFDDFETGILTIWPEEDEVKQDDTIECEIVDGSFGKEIKRPKKSGSGFKGGGFKPNPKKEALITASGIVKSFIDAKVITSSSDAEAALRAFHAVGMDLLKEES